MRSHQRLAWTTAFSILCLSNSAMPAEYVRRVIRAVRIEEPPSIDGDLSDACWQRATKFTEFILRERRSPLPFPTEAYLCYDERAIYVGFYCHDPEPERIEAHETKRDGRLFDDDMVQVAIDAKHLFRSYWRFTVNPLGAQADDVPEGAARNITWRGDWRAAARIVEDGWVCEIEIPFAILRYPRGTLAMGIRLDRRVSRLNDWATCPDTGPQWDARRLADWVGLDLPAPVSRPVWMPYSQVDYDDGSTIGGIGLDFKLETASGATHVGTINPDFKNIEGEVESVDFSYTERFVRDRRPFFLEGRGLFPSTRMFHSLRIGDVDVALKSFGRDIGRVSYGALATQKLAGDTNLCLTTRYRLADYNQSMVGLDQVYHFGDDGTNMAWQLGGGAQWDLAHGRWGVIGNYSRTVTSGQGGNGWAGGLRTYFDADPGHLGAGGGFGFLTAQYNPVLGFIPEKDLKSRNLWIGYGDVFESGRVEEYESWLEWFEQRRFNGDLYQSSVGIGGRCDLRPNLGLRLGARAGPRPPHYDRRYSATIVWLRRDLHRRGSLTLTFGQRNGGEHRYFALTQGLRPSQRLGFHLSLEHSRVDYPPTSTEDDYLQSQLIVSVNYDITPEKTVGGRLVAHGAHVGDLLGGGDINFYLTYRQAVRRGMDVFIILGDPNADRWRTRLAFKVVQPF